MKLPLSPPRKARTPLLWAMVFMPTILLVALLCVPRSMAAPRAERRLADSRLSAADITQTFTITGHVLILSLSAYPVLGIVVDAGSMLSATTDAQGWYTITGAATGTYTVSASLPSSLPCYLFGHFEPSSNQVSVPPDATQNFTADIGIMDYGIFGVVVDGAGAGISGVKISASGLPDVTTGTSGMFDWFPVWCGGEYVVWPEKPGYTFAPPSITITDLNRVGKLKFVGTDHRGFSYLPVIAQD